uniref:Uncharacterized protein n=1 Tax=Arundo donax TaxID=35708 RepID=A0A0A8YUS1_ARUDO
MSLKQPHLLLTKSGVGRRPFLSKQSSSICIANHPKGAKNSEILPNEQHIQ